MLLPHQTVLIDELILTFSSSVSLRPDRWRLRIRRKPDLSPSNSQSSFHSCADQNESSESETYGDDLREENNIDQDEYTWNSPAVVVHNILFGSLWCEYQGQIDIKHVQSNRHSLLTIKSHSWFASAATKTAELFKYSGIIYDGLFLIRIISRLDAHLIFYFR